VKTKRIVVVGAGPAGMMAAIRASALQQSVILIEKNPLVGKKLLLSGKGRCNLTNSCDFDSFLARFSKNSQFLRDAFNKFFNHDLMDFFEKRGLPLKTERQMRVFPVTDSSASVVKILMEELKKNHVAIQYKTTVRDLLIKDRKVAGVLLVSGKVLPADRVIIATGGMSYAFTGSTGQGFLMAQKTGHGVSTLKAGLVPLVVKDREIRFLEGLTLKNIRLTFRAKNKEIVSEIGELLFTGFGISGPLVLTLSGKVIDLLEVSKEVSVLIDMKPALSTQQLDSRLLREFKENSTKSIKNTLKTLLPKSMIDIVIQRAQIDPDKKANQVTSLERLNLLSLLKGFSLTVTGALPIEEAMVTRGGVSLKDINPRTMGSRVVEGLFFAGEMIDVDADTGGFNLQAAFSTGYLAGESSALD
jgi:predicted Rossmann fold flavoprotein